MSTRVERFTLIFGTLLNILLFLTRLLESGWASNFPTVPPNLARWILESCRSAIG